MIEIHLVLLFTLHNTKNIAYHITEVLIFYAYKLVVRAIPKIHVYLISRFYSNHENCENLMLLKYTCFTVSCHRRGTTVRPLVSIHVVSAFLTDCGNS